MLASILIKFKPQQELKIAGRGEEALFHLILDILSEKHPTFAQDILDETSETPVTLSPFLKGARFSGRHSYLSPKESVSFRITCLKKDLLEPVVQGLFSLSVADEASKLADEKIAIEKVDLQKSTPAHFISYEQLLTEAQPQPTIILEFCSPTSFGGLTGEQLFPLPRLVFTSLLEKWNAFSSKKMPLNLKKEFERIRIERFNLKTDSIHLREEKILGFIGTVAYEFLSSTKKEKRLAINALADFAFYSGVGLKTEIGMGQVRRKEK